MLAAEHVPHRCAQGVERSAGTQSSRTYVITRGVDEGVKGGHEPLRGHVGAEVAGASAPVDELSKAPVGGSMRATERFRGELLAGGPSDRVVALEVTPTHLKDSFQCLQGWPPFGLDRVEGLGRPPNRALHNRLQQRFACREMRIHRDTRERSLLRHRDDGRLATARQYALGGIEDGLNIALGCRSPVIGRQLCHLGPHGNGVRGPQCIEVAAPRAGRTDGTLNSAIAPSVTAMPAAAMNPS
jgi:hypothetical protein